MTQAAANLQKRIRDPEQEARIVYDDPWHWVVLENTGKKHLVNGRKPRIHLDFMEEKVSSTPFTATEEYKISYNRMYGEQPEQQQPEEISELDVDKMRARVNEICEIMREYENENVFSLNRKEIQLLGNLSKELSCLEEQLKEYENLEEVDQSIQAFEKRVEEQSYIEEDRYILDPENENHWLTYDEAKYLLTQYEDGLYDYKYIRPPQTTGDFEDMEYRAYIVDELKKVLSEPKPKVHIDEIAYELLDSMEEAQDLWEEENQIFTRFPPSMMLVNVIS